MQTEAEQRARFYLVVLMKQSGYSETEIADTLEKFDSNLRLHY